MARLVLLVGTLAIVVTGCSGSKHDASVRDVKRVLTAERLAPQKTRIVVTITTKPQFPPPRVNYCAAEAVRQPGATSLDVDHGRAIVMVFATRRDAADWTPMPECRAKPLHIANVVAVPTRGSLSPRLRRALARLR